MSTDTTTSLTLRPSPAVVNALLKWTAEDRASLAQLLFDSVREGFTSLEEVEERDRDMIRSRIEAYDRGEVKATDWRESLDRVERDFRAEFPK